MFHEVENRNEHSLKKPETLPLGEEGSKTQPGESVVLGITY